MRIIVSALAVMSLSAIMPFKAMAHDPQLDTLGTEGVALHEVTVVGDRMRHMNEAVKLDLKTNPVRSSQEVLRIVPGLFIAQHAGGARPNKCFYVVMILTTVLT